MQAHLKLVSMVVSFLVPEVELWVEVVLSVSERSLPA